MVERREAACCRAYCLCRRGGSYQVHHPDKVVGGCHQIAGQLSLLQTEIARSSEPTDRLHPAKDLLDPFADALTDGIPNMTGGSAVDGAAPPTGVLRDMGPDLSLAEVSHTRLGVVALVRAQRPWTEA